MIRLIASAFNSNKDKINYKHWKALSSYTHSGHLQLQFWLTSKIIEPHYSDEAITELLIQTRLISKLAFHAVNTISTEYKD